MSDLQTDNPDLITQEQLKDMREQCALAEKRAAETNDMKWKIIAQASRRTLDRWESEFKSQFYTNNNLSVADAPKTALFQMEINPDTKKQFETISAANGMTFTDAVNAFIQQSLDLGRLPFSSVENEKENP